MTVPSNKTREDYVGDGATTEWDYTFKIFDDSNLSVIYTDADEVDTELTLNTDYTVTNAGHPSGGKVKLQSGGTLTSAALTSSENLSIIRKLPITQLVDLRNQRAFFADTHEDVFDRLTMLIQQQIESIDRAAKLPQSVNPDDVDPTLPKPEGGHTLGWNPDGDALVNRRVVALDAESKFVVSDYSDLRSIKTGAIPTGYIVQVGGRSSVGDGGEGHFRWDSSDLSTEVGNDEVTTGEGDGGIYVAPDSDKTGANGAWVRQFSESVHVSAYGAKGDGSTDDVESLRAAFNSGVPLSFGEGEFRFTSSIEESVDRVNWSGGGAVLMYDGPQDRAAVSITCGMEWRHTVHGITFDGGESAHVSAEFIAATTTEPEAEWPDFYASQIVARNAYRASTDFVDGDGLKINGGFFVAQVNGVKVHDCYMAVGAEVTLSQGIFGISFASNGDRRCRHIFLSDYHIENVWSEDSTYKNDQDGVRVFQEIDERTGSCYLKNGIIKNVSNRAIKLHTGVNVVVDGLYRELDSNVIPQNGAFTNQPDIDSQSAPATIRNVRFHYDGAWHDLFVRNHTAREEENNYGGSVTDGITARLRNVPDDEVTAVSTAAESRDFDSAHRAAVSNIAVDGPLQRFLRVRIRGDNSDNLVTLVNAMARVTSEAISLDGDSGFTRVSGANIQNTGSPVPLAAGHTVNDRDVSVVSHYGFFADEPNEGGTGVSVGEGEAIFDGHLQAANIDDQRIGRPKVGYIVPSTAGQSDTEIVVLLNPTDQERIHTSGRFEFYRGVATSAGSLTVDVSLHLDDSTIGLPAAHVIASGSARKLVELITCTHDGVDWYAIKIDASDGGASEAVPVAFFTGNNFGGGGLKIVPFSEVSDASDFVQRSNFEPASTFLQPIRLPSYKIGSLPSASNFSECQIWVSDEAGGAQPAYSDGSDWRRFSDGSVVS